MKPRLSFLLAVACATLGDRLQGRALATNDDDAVFTPFESSRGLPTAAGTYVVFGRSRFNVAAAGDPVSVVHCVPRVVVVN